MKLSIVSPVYMAETIIPILVKRIEESIISITDDYEIILVEDCGTDNSWEVIEELAKSNNKIIGIKLSKNFGQHYAITAGIDNAQGDWVVVMDCDLQDRPEEIPRLYAKAISGFDIVLASRTVRQDNLIKKLFSKLFYWILSYLTETKQNPSVANFGIYSGKVIESIILLRESIRYFPTMVNWVGYKSIIIEVEHSKRLEGETSYNFRKLLSLALDIILAYSDKPIRLVIKTGVVISLVSGVVVVKTVVDYINGDIVVLGYASLLASLWLLSGFIISVLGVIGLYVGKTFEGVKSRPIYLIEKKIND